MTAPAIDTAATEPKKRSWKRMLPLLAALGPGIIAASAGNDAGGIATYSAWGASYGYDCRMYASSVSNHAIMGDMDGSWQVNHDTATQNHEQGQNVLYVDGSVQWKQMNYASNDPIDNIYQEGGTGSTGFAGGSVTTYWCADTDSYLVRGSVQLLASWSEYSQIQQ